jgi:DNA-binding transcriptional LysR family regulator
MSPARLPIEIRQLHCIVVLAEELHFGRAAKRLGIAQPHLSATVKRAETNLGVLLFERTPRVVLTEAGAAIVVAARRIVGELELGINRALHAGSGRSGTLVLGIASTAALSSLPQLLLAYRRAEPAVELRVREMHSAVQLEALRAGSIDAGVLREPPDSADFDEISLIREPFVAILPRSHPLARLHSVGPDRLRAEPLVSFTRAAAPSLHDQLGALLHRPRGFRAESEADEWHTIAALVGAGFGLSIAPASVSQLRLKSVTYVPIRTPGIVATLRLVWRKDAPPTVQRFARFVAAHAEG